MPKRGSHLNSIVGHILCRHGNPCMIVAEFYRLEVQRLRLKLKQKQRSNNSGAVGARNENLCIFIIMITVQSEIASRAEQCNHSVYPQFIFVHQ